MIGCAGGCGRETENATASGWTLLQITGRYRCAECDRNLSFVSSMEGGPASDEVDSLPPTSRGALKELPEMPPLRERPR